MPYVPVGPLADFGIVPRVGIRSFEAPPFLARKPMGPDFVQLGDITSDVGGAALRIGGVGVGALISPIIGVPSWVGGVVGYLLAAGVAKLGGES